MQRSRISNLKSQVSDIFSFTPVVMGLCLSFAWLASSALADAPATQLAVQQKVEVAIFPLAGTAADTARDQVGFALRMKLDRTGIYEAIDGPTMQDMANGQTIDAATPAKTVEDLSSDSKPQVIMWGQLDTAGDTTTLKLNLLDLRQPDAKPVEIDKHWNDPTQIRFRLEELLATLPGVEFEHPAENGVTDDPAARALWAKNPNLVVNGTFALPGHWDGIYQSEEYPVEISDHMPAVDKVCIVKAKGPDNRNVLAMNLSLNAAQNNGLACLSDAIKIEQNTRYRIQYRYKSDGPTLHVFVKGYTLFPDAATGKPVMRECYRRQVPPSGALTGNGSPSSMT